MIFSGGIFIKPDDVDLNQIRKKYENGEITYQKYQEYLSGQKADTIEINNQSVVIKESVEQKISSPPLSAETPVEKTTEITGVTIIGILFILKGILAFLVVTFLLGLVFLVQGDNNGLLFGGIFVLLGILYLAIGIGCFKAWKWVWGPAVILAIIGIVLAIVWFAMTGFDLSTIIGILIEAVILWYLFEDDVKKWFGKV